MKKYARLRQECSEFDNALYDATPEGSGRRSRPGGDGSFRIVAGELSGFAGALKKLGSFREVAAARSTQQQQASPCSNVGEAAAAAASESGRWAKNAETASLSGRWGSVSCTTDEAATRNASFRDSLSLSRSGRLVQEGEPWKAAAPSELPTISPPTATAAAASHGWLASVKRPLQPRKRATHYPPSDDDDPHEFNWRAATSSSTNPISSSSAPPRKSPPCATISQSMRYDRLKTIDLIDDDDASRSSQSVMQKAASMREGGAHSDAIMAMAKAYSEKHGVAQAILACVACGRSLGVVVQGNPANGHTSSFCQACRPHALSNWNYNHLATKAAPPPEAVKSKRKGMVHFCKKILRMGKKPNKSRS